MNDIVTKNAADIIPFASGPTGFESVDYGCVQRPYLAIAQGLSNMAVKGSTSYLPGLEPGMFYSPTTRQIFGTSIDVVILKFFPQYVIYSGLNEKNIPIGFQEAISKQDFERDRIKDFEWEKGKLFNRKTGQVAIDKRNFIVMFSEHIDWGMFLFSLQSTGVPISRRWITQAMSIWVTKDGKTVQAPIWSSVWRLTTAYQDKTTNFQIGSIERLGWVSKDIAPTIKGLFEELADMNTYEYARTEEEELHVVQEQSVQEPVQEQKVVIGSPQHVVQQQPQQPQQSPEPPKPPVDLNIW